jgi:DNA-binding NtrC family response regulator
MSRTNTNLIKVVAIDDDPLIGELISEALTQDDVKGLSATDSTRGLEMVLAEKPQIVVLDLVMPGVGGMKLLEQIVEALPGTNVILLTGHYSTESAVEAIQRGACDYLNKPVSLADLQSRVGKVLADVRKSLRTRELEAELETTHQFEGLLGRSPQMLSVFSSIRRIAPHFRTVLITGPTGTGKELAAEALHRLSPVGQTGRFVVCNCSAVVETLFESELFGHTKGSFTGAIADKVGLFEHSNEGTLFLDELGDMPISLQSKLLRALQNQEVRRVGSPSVKKVNVRVIAATNRDLKTMIAEKQFREDLYYRLSMVEIKMPSLAQREDDLPLLMNRFVERFSELYNHSLRGFTARAQAVLMRHTWPGNVRELENVVGNACMMATGPLIDVKDLPPYLLESPAPPAASSETDEILNLDEVINRHARFVLGRMGGNKVKTAEALGISRATLYRILDDVRTQKAAS